MDTTCGRSPPGHASSASASMRARVDALALETWPGGNRAHVVRITAFAVRGTAWTPAEVAAVSGPGSRPADS